MSVRCRPAADKRGSHAVVRAKMLPGAQMLCNRVAKGRKNDVLAGPRYANSIPMRKPIGFACLMAGLLVAWTGRPKTKLARVGWVGGDGSELEGGEGSDERGPFMAWAAKRPEF